MLCAPGTCIPTKSQLPVSRPSARVCMPVACAFADTDGKGLIEELGVAVGVGSSRDVALREGAGVCELAEPAGGGAQLTSAPITTTSSARFIARMMRVGLGAGLGGPAEDRDCYQGDGKSRRTECRSDPDHLRHAAIPLISHESPIARELEDEDQHDGQQQAVHVLRDEDER